MVIHDISRILMHEQKQPSGLLLGNEQKPLGAVSSCRMYSIVESIG